MRIPASGGRDPAAEAAAGYGKIRGSGAAAAGINQSDLSRIEKGLGNPSIATLARIAKALGGTLNISIDF